MSFPFDLGGGVEGEEPETESEEEIVLNQNETKTKIQSNKEEKEEQQKEEESQTIEKETHEEKKRDLEEKKTETNKPQQKKAKKKKHHKKKKSKKKRVAMVKDDENFQSKTNQIVLKPESTKTKTITKTVTFDKSSSGGFKFNKFRQKIKNLKKQITPNEEDKTDPKEQPTKTKTKKKKKKKKKQTSEFFKSIQEEGVGLKKDQEQEGTNQEQKKPIQEIDLKDNQKQPDQKETKDNEDTKGNKDQKESTKSKAKKTSEPKEKNQRGSLIKKPKFLRREKTKKKKELVNKTLENKRKEYNFVLKSIDSDFKTMKKKESGQLNHQLSSISSSVHKSLNVAQDVMRHIENSNTQIEDLIQTINTLSSNLQIVPKNTVKQK
ncbi:hypothetical protein M0812_05397 [Anaeramoeba flamelloides]|uniref:Uncharacterized protein n=1 Tax=Anaeramoeba flamelloides TaxID=1746091 RepID=A0AAV8A946_9EUKA|nr:hypothetical protein M0812_05397 [Anaeramoeba flamelloides]